MPACVVLLPAVPAHVVPIRSPLHCATSRRWLTCRHLTLTAQLASLLGPGFGTILSTAFIHMMLPAAEAFSNPCLPPWWTEAYEAWAYLLVTLAVLLMHLVDYLIKVGWAGVGRAGAGRARGGARQGGGHAWRRWPLHCRHDPAGSAARKAAPLAQPLTSQTQCHSRPAM